MIRAPVALPALALAGCLVVAERPCAEGDCPDGFACEEDGSGCLWECTSDSHCTVGQVCLDNGWCAPRCMDHACPGHYACAPVGNECLTVCQDSDHCALGYICCTGELFLHGSCDWMGACYLP